MISSLQVKASTTQGAQPPPERGAVIASRVSPYTGQCLDALTSSQNPLRSLQYWLRQKHDHASSRPETLRQTELSPTERQDETDYFQRTVDLEKRSREAVNRVQANSLLSLDENLPSRALLKRWAPLSPRTKDHLLESLFNANPKQLYRVDSRGFAHIFEVNSGFTRRWKSETPAERPQKNTPAETPLIFSDILNKSVVIAQYVSSPTAINGERVEGSLLEGVIVGITYDKVLDGYNFQVQLKNGTVKSYLTTRESPSNPSGFMSIALTVLPTQEGSTPRYSLKELKNAAHFDANIDAVDAPYTFSLENELGTMREKDALKLLKTFVGRAMTLKQRVARQQGSKSFVTERGSLRRGRLVNVSLHEDGIIHLDLLLSSGQIQTYQIELSTTPSGETNVTKSIDLTLARNFEFNPFKKYKGQKVAVRYVHWDIEQNPGNWVFSKPLIGNVTGNSWNTIELELENGSLLQIPVPLGDNDWYMIQPIK